MSIETTISLALIVGASTSKTLTTWVAVEILPTESLTVYVTIVTPIWNCEGALFVEPAIPQSSFVSKVPRLGPIAKHDPLSAFIVMFGSPSVIVGSVLSVKVTSWVTETVFPAESEAVHVTVVVPEGNDSRKAFI